MLVSALSGAHLALRAVSITLIGNLCVNLCHSQHHIRNFRRHILLRRCKSPRADHYSAPQLNFCKTITS